jgi:CheY-like chemotaxis protein
VLDGLQRTLRTGYRVLTTTDPQEALEELTAAEDDDPVTVFISDMRMPSMSGVAVLERAQQDAPDTTRVLLTGDADIENAVAAINRGNIFRFVLKPCPPETLRDTIAAATQQHRLLRAERELLRDTVKGCVDALMDTLAMAQPALFSRGSRLRRLAQEVCRKLNIPDAWQIEMAAQLGEIGAITLPPTAVDALQGGMPGGNAEAEMLAALPGQADSVLARIPRLEAVRDIVRHQLPTDRKPMLPLAEGAPEGARLLQAVREFDALVYRGMPDDLALATLSVRKTHEKDVILALASIAGMRLPNEAVKELTVDELAIGDELVDDLSTATGLLLVSRGQVISERLLTRVRNFAATTGLRGRILVTDHSSPR